MILNTIHHQIGTYGHTPDALKVLVYTLATHPLDPAFESVGGFGPYPALRCCSEQMPDGSTIYHPGPPIHAAHPDAVRFFGNFANLSLVFTVDTDDDATIAFLRDRIAENRQTRAYKLARDAVAARGRG